MAIGPPVFNDHVLAFDVARFLEALAEPAQTIGEKFGGFAVEKSDHRHWRVLPAYCEWAEDSSAKADERSPLHHSPSTAQGGDTAYRVRLTSWRGRRGPRPLWVLAV